LEGGNINLISDRGGATGADVVAEHDRLGGFGRFVVGELAEVGGIFEFAGTSVDIISGHIETKAVGGGGSPGTTKSLSTGGVIAGGVRNVGGGYLMTERVCFVGQNLISAGADTGDRESVLIGG